jgi:hypothetical protein
LRVSKRGLNDVPLVSLDDNSYFTKEVREELKLKSYGLRNYGCRTLELAYLSSARFIKTLNMKFFLDFIG